MELKIVSWNIRKAVGLDWRRDPDRVLRVLSATGADIVLLQEADRRMAPRPPALSRAAIRQAGYEPLDPHPATPSIGHHGNAVLVWPDLLATRIEGLDLPGFEPRGALLVRIEGRGGAVTLGGMHLGLRRGDRLRQLASVTAALRGFGTPAVLGGDLNEWRSGAAALPLPRGWRVVAPGPTFHAARPMMRLDRFLVGPGVAVTGSGVIPKAEALRASDHLPIWVRLRIGGRPDVNSVNE